METGLCFVNLSGASLNDRTFPRFLKRRIERHGIPPARLCFEITETVAIRNLKRASQVIRELKELGCRFAVDDFGSGMSSFSYLKSLPVDFLKIDGSLVTSTATHRVDRSIVAAIQEIADGMSITTIAEFVESPEIMTAWMYKSTRTARGGRRTARTNSSRRTSPVQSISDLHAARTNPSHRGRRGARGGRSTATDPRVKPECAVGLHSQGIESRGRGWYAVLPPPDRGPLRPGGIGRNRPSVGRLALERLRAKIRDIPDFPKPGVVYRDITPLVRDPAALRLAVHELVHPFFRDGLTAVVGMEARGFIFGSLAAWELGIGFVPLRKPGKLPYDVHSISYDLEYGSESLEVHVDALTAADRVLVVDDVLATGGTSQASCALIEKLGAQIAACAFVVELDFLRGRERLEHHRVHSLLHY